MDMCYDGTLVMPSSYAVMDEDEMSFTDGGWYVKRTWYGCDIYLTHNERKAVSNAGFVLCIPAAFGDVLPGAVLGALASVLWNMDDGHGVKIKLALANGRVLRGALVLGIYTLSEKQENTIAKRNNIGK